MKRIMIDGGAIPHPNFMKERFYSMMFPKFWKKYAVALVAVTFIVLWTCIVWAIAGAHAAKKASNQTREEVTRVYTEQIAQMRREQEQARAVELASEEIQREAEAIAKVLYGVKNNSSEDLRTYAWCIFNRVDNGSYPNTLDEVIGQPGQWMAYSVNNAVLDSIYQIALEELTTWRTGHRPVTSDFVYMNWTPGSITLRDSWKDGSSTHYWRYGK